MTKTTMHPTPITQERIDELQEQLRQGTLSDEAEREIWQAAKMVPALVDMLRNCIEALYAIDGDDADELRRNARFLIGE